MHEVEGMRRQAGRCRVRVDEIDDESVLLGEPPPRLHHLDFSVQTNHPSVCANPLGKQVDHTENATTDVDHRAARLDADQVKQFGRVLGVDLGLLDQVA